MDGDCWQKNSNAARGVVAAVMVIRTSCILVSTFAALCAGVTSLHAQALPDVETRLPQGITGADDSTQGSHAFPAKPSLRDGILLASAQPSDIERRLPKRDDPTPQTQTDQPALLPPPPLRDDGPAPFLVFAVEINGASVFPPETFATLYDDMLARAVSLTEITALTDRITAMYRREGYFLSRAIAPAQDISGGILKIDIVEGYISVVTVKGGAPSAVKRRLDALKTQRPLRLASLERALALIGDLKGVSIASSQLEPDIHDLASHRLVVKVDMDQFEASLYADNRGTDNAGPVQTYARAAANSIFRTGDQLSIGLFTIPDDPDELILGDVSYQMPLTDAGTYVTLSGMVSKFDAGASLAALGVESRTKRVSIRFSHPIIRRRKLSLWGNIGVDGRNIMEEQLGAPQFEDRIRVVHASVNYRQNYWSGITNIYARASHGVDMFDASATGVPLSRPDADGGFTKVEGQISRYQNIGKTFGLYTSASGQFSTDPLLASEEFALGGARYGRAYDYAELTGDDGVAVLVELRHGRDPGIALLDFYQIYGFYDYGAVWNDNVSAAFSPLTLSSAGAGIRLTLPTSLYLTFEAARPLDRTPFTQDDRDWRGFFSVSKDF